MNDTDDTDEICPVCGEEYNHFIDNGHRNGWPTKGDEAVASVKFEVCTPTDDDFMYVHTEDIKQMFNAEALDAIQTEHQRERSGESDPVR